MLYFERFYCFVLDEAEGADEKERTTSEIPNNEDEKNEKDNNKTNDETNTDNAKQNRVKS